MDENIAPTYREVTCKHTVFSYQNDCNFVRKKLKYSQTAELAFIIGTTFSISASRKWISDFWGALTRSKCAMLYLHMLTQITLSCHVTSFLFHCHLKFDMYEAFVFVKN